MPASSAKSRTEQAAVGGRRPFPDGYEVRDGEMALVAIGGVGVGESSALGRNVFGVRRDIFRVAKIAVPARRRLGKRLRKELDAVRDLLSQVELYSCVPGAAGNDGRLFAPVPEAAVVEDDGCSAAKSRKVSPLAGRRTRESKPDDRERLAGRLASMAAALPDHLVAFLQNPRVGDADSSRGDDGDIEMCDVQSMKDGALFQLKMLLDKFAPEKSTPKSHGGRAPLAASGISCLSQAQHQEAGGSILRPVQEEEEEGINICGGVARMAIRDIAEEYGELVSDIGVELLSPLQRKYVDLAIDDEQDRYVDICGDASPVVFPAKTSPNLSSSRDSSDATSSTDSDSDSSSSSPEAPPKENSYCRAGEPVPAAPEADPIHPPESAPEANQIAEPENQCAATVSAITKSPPAPPPVLPEECGTLAHPPPLEQALESVQIAEPEALKEKRVAPAATVHPIIGSAPAPPAVLPNENGSSSQPAPVPAPVTAHIPQPQPQPQEVETSDLIAMARQEAKRRAMAKARQELLEMERAALPDKRIHPLDMELLGLAAFEHVVSTVRDARTAQPQVNGEVVLRVSPGRPSILRQLGVFLKADDGGDEEEEPPPPLAVATEGEDMGMEMEEGQIL